MSDILCAPVPIFFNYFNHMQRMSGDAFILLSVVVRRKYSGAQANNPSVRYSTAALTAASPTKIMQPPHASVTVGVDSLFTEDA